MKPTVYIGALLLTAILPVQANTLPSAAAACVACHGDNGEGNAALGAPRLAGQKKEYLLDQLKNFKSGQRGYDPTDVYGAQMRAQAQRLDDSELNLLAHYFSGLSGSHAPQNVSVSDAGGQTLFDRTCAACHGPDGKGFAHLKTPDLTILESAYVQRQLSNYRSGLRGSEDHASQLGIWMRGISLQINSDQEREALVSYISTLAGRR